MPLIRENIEFKRTGDSKRSLDVGLKAHDRLQIEKDFLAQIFQIESSRADDSIYRMNLKLDAAWIKNLILEYYKEDEFPYQLSQAYRGQDDEPEYDELKKTKTFEEMVEYLKSYVIRGANHRVGYYERELESRKEELKRVIDQVNNLN